MSTVDLQAKADYQQSGQYIARLLGRNHKYTFRREFVGRNDYTEFTTDEVGLFEVCDSTRKGKERRYRITAPDEKGEMFAWKISLETAMKIAKWMDDRYHLESCFRIINDSIEILDPTVECPMSVEEAVVQIAGVLSKLDEPKRHEVLERLRLGTIPNKD